MNSRPLFLRLPDQKSVTSHRNQDTFEGTLRIEMKVKDGRGVREAEKIRRHLISKTLFGDHIPKQQTDDSNLLSNSTPKITFSALAPSAAPP